MTISKSSAYSLEDLVLKGFYLFPCDGKRPLVKWSKESTKDLTIIRRWAKRFPSCNWGIDCGKSGIVVLDDDRGKNREAMLSMDALKLEYGPLPITFRVKTVSGGFHYYFYGEGRNSASARLGNGLDSRGVGGYVIAPCSMGYEVVDHSAVANAPNWLIDLIGKPLERKSQPIPDNIILDTPFSIQRAVKYLQSTDPAIEGQGGDAYTYRVACQVREFSISQDMCLELMLEHWDHRCLPQWGEELAAKVANAYQYAATSIGATDATLVFTEFSDTTLPKDFFVDIADLLNRKITINYLVDKVMETPATGLMFGDTQAGKTFVAVDLAMCVATGIDWLGHPVKKGKVFYFAMEGQAGLPRRVAAWLKAHKMTLKPGMLFMPIVRFDLSTKSVKMIEQKIRELLQDGTNPALIIIDTMARYMPVDADENSNKDVGNFFNALDHLKDAFQCTTLTIHHTGHNNKERARGAYNIKAILDFEIRVEQKGIITFTKMKDAEEPEPIGFRRETVELEPGITSQYIVKVALEKASHLDGLSKSERIALEVLQIMISESKGRPIRKEDWKKRYFDQMEEDSSKSYEIRKWQKAVQRLRQSKMINDKQGFATISVLTEVDTDD